MNTLRSSCVALGGLLLLGASSTARAACAPTSVTGATTTMEQGGQGNLSCGNFTSSGIALSPLKQSPSNQAEIAITTNPDGSIDWDILSPPDHDVDAMLIEAADGKRCLYFYPGESDFSGSGLTTANNKSVKTVVACGNGVAAPTTASLSVNKSFDGFTDIDGSGDVTVGDVLNYTLTATNTGNAALTGVSIADDIATPSSCNLGNLLPGNSSSCVVTYEVTPADAIAGSVVNTATASSNQTADTSDSASVIVVPPGPISNVDGTCAVDGRAGGLQGGVDANNDVATVIGIGTSPDGNPVVAICSDMGQQIQCAKQCRPPAGFPVAVGPDSAACQAALNAANGPGPNGELPLECRVCELSSVLPPGQQAGGSYCWEESHQVDEIAGTFIVPKFAEETVARARRIVGSQCYEITLNFYGVEYTYYTPTGCPGSN